MIGEEKAEQRYGKPQGHQNHNHDNASEPDPTDGTSTYLRVVLHTIARTRD